MAVIWRRHDAGAQYRSPAMPQTFNVGSRSLFVTTVAWVFIVLAALATVSAAVQNATVASMAPGLKLLGSVQPLPLITGLLMAYLPWVVGVGLVVSLATLVCAVGLLLRLEWARRVFIGLLGVAIAANLAGLWVHQELMQSVVNATLGATSLPPAAADVLGGFAMATRTFSIAVSLVACGLLAWTIRRLMSPTVRQEFA
jgi:hypothetical protein